MTVVTGSPKSLNGPKMGIHCVRWGSIFGCSKDSLLLVLICLFQRAAWGNHAKFPRSAISIAFTVFR